MYVVESFNLYVYDVRAMEKINSPKANESLCEQRAFLIRFCSQFIISRQALAVKN